MSTGSRGWIVEEISSDLSLVHMNTRDGKRHDEAWKRKQVGNTRAFFSDIAGYLL